MKTRSANSKSIWVIFLGLILFSFILGGCEERVTLNAGDYLHTSPSSYYLYVPQDYTPEKTYPLWVHIHGDGGSARIGCWDQIQQFAEEYNFILVCPLLNASDNHLYYEYGVSLLNPIIYQVSHQYNVSSKIFLSGFSGGGYFVQLYANDYPNSISGLTIMSAALFLNTSNSILRSIPILITVGEWDGDKPQAAQGYYDSLILAGYNADLEILNNVGHVFTEGAVEFALKKFEIVYPQSPY